MDLLVIPVLTSMPDPRLVLPFSLRLVPGGAGAEVDEGSCRGLMRIRCTLLWALVCAQARVLACPCIILAPLREVAAYRPEVLQPGRVLDPLLEQASARLM